jgi:hypothetical protein
MTDILALTPLLIQRMKTLGITIPIRTTSLFERLAHVSIFREGEPRMYRPLPSCLFSVKA